MGFVQYFLAVLLHAQLLLAFPLVKKNKKLILILFSLIFDCKNNIIHEV